MFLLLILNIFSRFSTVSIVDFEQVNVSWEAYLGSWQSALMEFFVETVNGWKSLTIFQKTFRHRCFSGSFTLLIWLWLLHYLIVSELYLGHLQTSKMECFATTVNTAFNSWQRSCCTACSNKHCARKLYRSSFLFFVNFNIFPWNVLTDFGK